MAFPEGPYKLFVGDLPSDVSEDELRMVFGTYGEVTSVKMMNPQARTGQRCALLFYTKKESAEDAIKVLDGQYKIRENAEQPIKVSWAKDKNAAPVSAGGERQMADQDGYKLFVGGLPLDIKAEELQMVFGTYGQVNKVFVMPPHQNSGRVAAFVFYAKTESGDDAISVLDQQYKIRVDAEQPIQVRWAATKDKGTGKGGWKDGKGDWSSGGGGGGDYGGSSWGASGSGGKGGGRESSKGGDEQVRTADGWKLFVGGLPIDCTEEELKSVFSTYGEVAKVHLMQPHAVSGRVAAFVFYNHVQAADDAIKVLNGIYKIREHAEAPIQVRWGSAQKGGDKGGGGGKGSWDGKAGGDYGKSGDWGKGKGGDWGGGGGKGGASEIKLFVGNLPEDITEESVRYVFATYGQLNNVHIMTGKSKTGAACAFVEYASADQADTAILTLNDKYEIKPGAGPILVKKAHSAGNRSRPY